MFETVTYYYGKFKQSRNLWRIFFVMLLDVLHVSWKICLLCCIFTRIFFKNSSSKPLIHAFSQNYQTPIFFSKQRNSVSGVEDFLIKVKVLIIPGVKNIACLLHASIEKFFVQYIISISKIFYPVSLSMWRYSNAYVPRTNFVYIVQKKMHILALELNA